jgi:hypothetical protein
MTISDLKDLEKLIKLCRKTGVSNITIDGIVLELGYEPLKTFKGKPMRPMLNKILGEVGEDTPIIDNIQTDELTEEQLLYYSAVPHDTGNEG